jgi:hypothetical protein
LRAERVGEVGRSVVGQKASRLRRGGRSGGDFSKARVHTASRWRTCDWCHRMIERGDRYVYLFGVSDGVASPGGLCGACAPEFRDSRGVWAADLARQEADSAPA